MRSRSGELWGASVMNGVWGHESDTRMTMLGVVPGKECLAVSPGILDAAEAIREVRTIFTVNVLKCDSENGIVIGNIRTL